MRTILGFTVPFWLVFFAFLMGFAVLATAGSEMIPIYQGTCMVDELGLVDPQGKTPKPCIAAFEKGNEKHLFFAIFKDGEVEYVTRVNIQTDKQKIIWRRGGVT